MSTTEKVPPTTRVNAALESPFAQLDHVAADGLLGGAPPAHTYGAASMQTYADGQVAFHTHASADGFLAYVNQFEPTSFRAKDGQVEWWQYSPTYDDWQDNYGCDSVEVFYHAGHGGTDPSSGNYSAPLGTTWGNQEFLNSQAMSIGDQRLRYLFLATCEGCMVFAPNNPLRTWNPPNRGLRMVFGATANIYDNPDYGTKFWNHWKTGSSFSQAWQDALLDVSSGHQPSSTACGATASEASTRLFNERFFQGGSVNRDWYWWRWVGNPPAAPSGLALAVPSRLRFPRLTPFAALRPRLLERVRALGIELDAESAEELVEGARLDGAGPRVALVPGGGLTIEHRPAAPRRSPLSGTEAAAVAREAIAGSADAVLLSAVTPALHAGGTTTGGGALIEAEVYEHVVSFRQEVAGLTVVTPGAGEIRVHVDHTGEVRRIVDTRLEVVDIRDHGPQPTVRPAPGGGELCGGQLGSADDVLDALERAAHVGPASAVNELVRDSVEIGYSVRGTDLVPVARAAVEFGSADYRMLRAIEVPLVS